MNWWQIIVGTVIGTLGIVFIRGAFHERRGLPWRTTLGKVTEFEGYIEETDDRWPCPSARIKFRYEVDGAEYSLGYKPQEASRNVRAVAAEGLSTEELIRRALRRTLQE